VVADGSKKDKRGTKNPETQFRNTSRHEVCFISYPVSGVDAPRGCPPYPGGFLDRFAQQRNLCLKEERMKTVWKLGKVRVSLVITLIVFIGMSAQVFAGFWRIYPDGSSVCVGSTPCPLKPDANCTLPDCTRIGSNSAAPGSTVHPGGYELRGIPYLPILLILGIINLLGLCCIGWIVIKKNVTQVSR
jgi:hypothetical protein